MLDQDLPVVFGNFPIESFINLRENLKEINFKLDTIDYYFYFKSGRWGKIILLLGFHLKIN